LLLLPPDKEVTLEQLDWLLAFTEYRHNGTILKEQADVAQLVEQLIRNQQVVSSSLTVGSIESII
jgi:hypothetical protein